jgi:tRNA-dihydrouridine synthase B
MQFAGFHLAQQSVRRAHGRGHGSSFPPVVQEDGRGLAVSEMVTSNSLLYGSAKTQRRANHDRRSVDPISVQIAGADPAMMAEAARHNADNGAQIIDINMGCPAKKVCNVMAGSALMQDEPLVGADPRRRGRRRPGHPGHAQVPHRLEPGQQERADHRPHRRIESGIRAIAIHGRTRADQYTGEAEYDTIAYVKTLVRIPVIANGDITRRKRPRHVLDYTGADGIMIGRAAQGRPWLFREIEHFLPPARICRRRWSGRFTASCWRTSPTSTPSTARNRGQDRPQAHQLVHQGPGRLGGSSARTMNTLPTASINRCRQ